MKIIQRKSSSANKWFYWELFSLAKFDVTNASDDDKILNFTIDLKPTFELFSVNSLT
jgi:hypothetical protein